MEFTTHNSIIEYCNKPRYKDLLEIIAIKAMKLTIGKTLIFNSEELKIQETLFNWMNTNNVLEKLRKNEYVLSKYGKGILYLNPTKSGNITLKYLKNPFDGRVSKIDEIEQIAEIWDKSDQSDTKIFRKITYTPNTIEVITYTANNSRIGSTEININNDLTPIDKYTIKNELGFMPFIELENLPANNMFGNTTFNFKPDWLPVYRMIDDFQELLRIKEVERKANRTRVIGRLDNKTINDMKQKGQNMNGLDDLLKDAYIYSSLNTGYEKGSGNSTSIEVIQGKPDLNTYAIDGNWTEEQIFNGAGYSPPKVGSNESYSNKTESLFADKLDIETTLFKQSLRKEKFYKLFDYVLKFYNIEPLTETGERKYSFDFIQLSMIDKVKKLETNTLLLADNIISRAEYRADMYDIPINIAEKLIPDEEYITGSELTSNQPLNDPKNNIKEKEVL